MHDSPFCLAHRANPSLVALAAAGIVPPPGMPTTPLGQDSFPLPALRPPSPPFQQRTAASPAWALVASPSRFPLHPLPRRPATTRPQPLPRSGVLYSSAPVLQLQQQQEESATAEEDCVLAEASHVATVSMDDTLDMGLNADADADTSSVGAMDVESTASRPLRRGSCTRATSRVPTPSTTGARRRA
ncbi:hypothetical protein BC834DRAFT_389116 [Gloeopeniophorella convolvens]|nr:hypothetical protein BC834DRAFT_389116 [Gloeopeniophorella convolvens]